MRSFRGVTLLKVFSYSILKVFSYSSFIQLFHTVAFNKYLRHSHNPDVFLHRLYDSHKSDQVIIAKDSNSAAFLKLRSSALRTPLTDREIDT